jgi:hypothetical protein
MSPETWEEHCNEKHALRAEIIRLRSLVQCLLDNDPNDDAADGVTVLMAWRKEARAVLGS